MKTLKIFLLLFIMFAADGCIHQIALSSFGGIMDSGFEVLNEEQDLNIADKSIASNLKLLETILREDPGNDHYLTLAAQGYASYALGFVEDESPERARILYLRGKGFGMQVLDRNKKFSDAREKGLDEFRAGLSTFTGDATPVIFWTALGWGSYIQWNLTDPNAIADIPKVEAMMQFVLEHDSTYFYGGAQFFLGTLYGSRSKILGGDPDRSQTYFRRCLAINKGQFLMTYVYYARSYAVQTQNRELFEECIAKVDSASIDLLPKARLSNAIAKKKAALLRAKIEHFF